MGRATITVFSALGEAADFTRQAWRDLWGIQTLFAAAVAAIFFSTQGAAPSDIAWDVGSVGWSVLLAATAPLIGALLRLYLGGSALRGLGPAGLQFGRTELRLAVLIAAALGAIALAILPLIAISAVIFILLHDLGMTQLPLIGAVRVPFLVAAMVWILGIGGLAYGAARMSAAPVATVGKRRFVLAEGWALGRRHAWTTLFALILSLSPMVLLTSLLVWMDTGLGGDLSLGPAPAQALVDTVLKGAVIGGVMAFIQAPLTLGVTGAAYCAQRALRWRQTRIPTPAISESRLSFALR